MSHKNPAVPKQIGQKMSRQDVEKNGKLDPGIANEEVFFMPTISPNFLGEV